MDQQVGNAVMQGGGGAVSIFDDQRASLNASVKPKWDETVNEACGMAALGTMASWDGRLALSKLTMPTLVLRGNSDLSYCWPQVESLWTNLSNVRLSVVPGAAHAVHLEKPALFHTLTLNFLNEG